MRVGWAWACLFAVLLPDEAHARCREVIAVLPFEALASDRKSVQEAERSARAALETVAPGCLQSRDETVRRLQATGAGTVCAEDTCRREWARRLEAWIFQGIVIGAGGAPRVSLALWGTDGESGRRVAPVASADDPAAPPGELAEALRQLWNARRPRLASRADLGVIPQVTLGAGAIAIAGAVVLGVQARRTEEALSRGNAGCPPEVLAACLSRKLEEGRTQALWSNVLSVGGGLLAVGGGVMLVWSLP